MLVQEKEALWLINKAPIQSDVNDARPNVFLNCEAGQPEREEHPARAQDERASDQEQAAQEKEVAKPTAAPSAAPGPGPAEDPQDRQDAPAQRPLDPPGIPQPEPMPPQNTPPGPGFRTPGTNLRLPAPGLFPTPDEGLPPGSGYPSGAAESISPHSLPQKNPALRPLAVTTKRAAPGAGAPRTWMSLSLKQRQPPQAPPQGGPQEPQARSAPSHPAAAGGARTGSQQEGVPLWGVATEGFPQAETAGPSVSPPTKGEWRTRKNSARNRSEAEDPVRGAPPGGVALGSVLRPSLALPGAPSGANLGGNARLPSGAAAAPTAGGSERAPVPASRAATGPRVQALLIRPVAAPASAPAAAGSQPILSLGGSPPQTGIPDTPTPSSQGPHLSLPPQPLAHPPARPLPHLHLDPAAFQERPLGDPLGDPLRDPLGDPLDDPLDDAGASPVDRARPTPQQRSPGASAGAREASAARQRAGAPIGDDTQASLDMVPLYEPFPEAVAATPQPEPSGSVVADTPPGSALPDPSEVTGPPQASPLASARPSLGRRLGWGDFDDGASAPDAGPSPSQLSGILETAVDGVAFADLPEASAAGAEDTAPGPRSGTVSGPSISAVLSDADAGPSSGPRAIAETQQPPPGSLLESSPSPPASPATASGGAEAHPASPPAPAGGSEGLGARTAALGDGLLEPSSASKCAPASVTDAWLPPAVAGGSGQSPGLPEDDAGPEPEPSFVAETPAGAGGASGRSQWPCTEAGSAAVQDLSGPILFGAGCSDEVPARRNGGEPSGSSHQVVEGGSDSGLSLGQTFDLFLLPRGHFRDAY